MVVEIVGNVMQQGVKMEAIIADDETAAISNIQRNQDPGLKKYSDKTISKRIFQSQGNLLAIEMRLSALSLHPFADCSGEWCLHREDQTKEYNSLLYGKPLTSTEPQEEIAQILIA